VATADLAAADPLAAARTWLLSHPAITWPIESRNQAPYPCVVLTDPPSGSMRGARWLIAPELTLHALGDPDGSTGKAELRRILVVTLSALIELPDYPTAPGAPVVTNVESSGSVGWSPEPTGQPRYVTSVRMYMHPPQAVITPPPGP
jgi:hypothetical protein